MNARVPAEVFSPGEYLSDELEARGWSQIDLADIIGRAPTVINQIVSGKRSITPDLAKLIGAALGTSPIMWLNLEAAYRLHTDETPVSNRVARNARLRDRFAVREMVKRKWVEPTREPEVLEARVCKFFGISTIDETPRLAHAAKRTDYPDTLNPAQLAWLFRVKQVAEAVPVQSYSERAMREALPRLRTLLRAPEGVQYVPEILRDCGIRFVIVEHVASSKIDGVTFWLKMGNKLEPVIGMSLRLDRIDNFWFVLRHEIEHVLQKHGREIAIVDTETDGVDQGIVTEEEKIANLAGADFCVPEAEMAGFILRYSPLFSEEKVNNFANRMQVDPGIVVGQIQKRTGKWHLFRHHLAKVRHLITPVAMTDGYGQILSLST